MTQIVIPRNLQEAIKQKQVVLFLGAGASKEVRDDDDASPPGADELRDLLAQEFFGKEMPGRDLMLVAEMAIESSGGRPNVYKKIKDIFDHFDTSPAHIKISEFQWRKIVTTNYDTYLENAYSSNRNRKQQLVPIVKDSQPVDRLLRDATNGIEYIKLHGCLDHIYDNEIKLILSKDQYNYVELNRKLLYSRLEIDAPQYILLFIGYRLDDQHIRRLIYEIPSAARPRWYFVSPDVDADDTHFWSAKNVEVIKATFGEFTDQLAVDIAPLFRFVNIDDNTASNPIRRHYRRPSIETSRLSQALARDAVLVHPGMPLLPQDAKGFYSGHDTGWGAISQGLDIKRKAVEDILLEVFVGDHPTDGPSFFVLRGAGGSGKTIALKRAAYDAAAELDVAVLWLKSGGALDYSTIKELTDLIDKPIYIFIDELAMNAEQALNILRTARDLKKPVIVVGAERDSDWFNYCHQLESEFDPETFRLGRLSESEADRLLTLLDKHGCLGLLAEYTRDEQIHAFMASERADRQLLVALHELTLGKPFSDIVFDEFERVTPLEAKQLYLDIATMHQFKLGIRAGSISRISNISFNDFSSEFVSPLEGLVHSRQDPYTGDFAYYTRHSRVAELVFQRAAHTDSQKSRQLSRLLEGLDIGFSGDLRALRDILRGRSLAETFRDASHGRRLFELATEMYASQAWICQQRAIFELYHANGEIEAAQEYIELASALDPHNKTIIHTEAEITRQRASLASSEPLKESLRAKSRNLLAKMPANDSFATLTRCKLLTDEALEQAQKVPESASGREAAYFAELVGSAQAATARAQQAFPEQPEFSQIEARLTEGLHGRDHALAALTRAWSAGARGTGTAIKLAKIYQSNSQQEKAEGALRDALSRYPDDKSAHFELAKLLVRAEEPHLDSALLHLRRSFDSSDNNFDERYYTGQLYFLMGKIDECVSIFSDINSNAPVQFRKFPPVDDNEITEKIEHISGTITAIKSSFLFVKYHGYPNDIFVHYSHIDQLELDEIATGDSVEVKLRFCRTGPVGVWLRRNS